MLDEKGVKGHGKPLVGFRQLEQGLSGFRPMGLDE
jgi:hypothetical protein